MVSPLLYLLLYSERVSTSTCKSPPVRLSSRAAKSLAACSTTSLGSWMSTQRMLYFFALAVETAMSASAVTIPIFPTAFQRFISSSFRFLLPGLAPRSHGSGLRFLNRPDNRIAYAWLDFPGDGFERLLKLQLLFGSQVDNLHPELRQLLSPLLIQDDAVLALLAAYFLSYLLHDRLIFLRQGLEELL